MKIDEPNKCDFIIAGMGCAGLSLAMQLKTSAVKFKKVVLFDEDLKNKNDRTWCFWTKHETNWFDDVVFRKWKKFTFKSKGLDKTIGLGPYTYMMIRGLDFYEFCLNTLRADPRFEIITDKIVSIGTRGCSAYLETETRSFSADCLFNSAFRNLHIQTNHINYLQHFKGWVIETEEDTFDADVPVFMDFDIAQYNDCRFVYLLPFSKTKALVEYTGFSKEQLNDEEYDFELKNYINARLTQKNYTILEVEKGKIPMYESEFINPFGDKVINIGTTGGCSKPSTGYTFYFIQRHTQYLVQQLEKGIGKLMSPVRKNRYSIYDRTLLDVIDKKKIESRSVFSDLFQKNQIHDLLAFLNEESSWNQDYKIMISVPKMLFAKSALKKMLS